MGVEDGKGSRLHGVTMGQFTVLKDLRTGGGSHAGSIQTCSANKRERAFKPSRAGSSEVVSPWAGWLECDDHSDRL